MKKLSKPISAIAIVLLLNQNAMAQECEFVDPSPPSALQGATYESKNGFSISPYGNYRVLNLMINIIYDATPNDPLAGAPSNYWDPGTSNTVNSNPPTNLTSFMDADFATVPPQGIFTRKYYELSFGALTVKKILYL